MKLNQLIVVTGLQYSLTTVIGEFIAKSVNGYYIHEPFNPKMSFTYPRISVPKHWINKYQLNNIHIHELRTILSKSYFDRMYLGVRASKKIRKFTDVMRLIYQSYNLIIQKKYCIIKDPFSLLILDELSELFKPRIVITEKTLYNFVNSVFLRNTKVSIPELVQFMTYLNVNNKDLPKFLNYDSSIDTAILEYFFYQKIKTNIMPKLNCYDDIIFIDQNSLRYNTEATLSDLLKKIGDFKLNYNLYENLFFKKSKSIIPIRNKTSSRAIDEENEVSKDLANYVDSKWEALKRHYE